jgi:hypothetical protein
MAKETRSDKPGSENYAYKQLTPSPLLHDASIISI